MNGWIKYFIVNEWMKSKWTFQEARRINQMNYIQSSEWIEFKWMNGWIDEEVNKNELIIHLERHYLENNCYKLLITF